MVSNVHITSWLNNQEFDQLIMEVGDDVLLAHQMKRKESL